MSTIQGALDLVRKAVALDNSGKQQEAVSIYALAIEHLYQILERGGVDNQTRELLNQKIQEYTKRVDYLKSTLNLNLPPPTTHHQSSSSPVSSFPSLPPLNSSTSSFSNPQDKELIIQNALANANQAVKCETENRISDAVTYYNKCADLLNQASLLESNIEVRLQLMQKKQEYSSRAEQLQSTLPFSSSNGMSSSLNSGLFADVPFPQVNDIDMSVYSNIELSANSSEYIDMAINYTTEAVKEDDVHNYTKAIPLYQLSVDYFSQALQCEINESVRALILEKMTNSKIRCEFLKNKINYQSNGNEQITNIPFSLKPGGKYKDPVRKKSVMEKLVKTIKGPKNISDHWL